jgi:hypothetical protein
MQNIPRVSALDGFRHDGGPSQKERHGFKFTIMNDAELNQLLRDAKPDLQMEPGFRRKVWQRIETAEGSNWMSLIRRTFASMAGSLALPPVAAATCAAAIIAGLLLGTLSSRPGAHDAIGYLRSISPFVHNSSQ